MGAGASIDDGSETIDRDRAIELVGEAWDESLFAAAANTETGTVLVTEWNAFVASALCGKSPEETRAERASEGRHLDGRIAELQRQRDASDDATCERLPFGAVVAAMRRRATTLDECRVLVLRARGGYPTLAFVVGEDHTAPKTMYATQCFYLRNQAASGWGYWRADPAVRGLMNGEAF